MTAPIHALRIDTERLRLHAATKRLAEAAVKNKKKLGDLLEADVPQAWPPELMRDVVGYYAERLAGAPDLAGWLNWYVVLKDDEGTEDALIGEMGFNGLDTADGTLMLGYCLLPAFHGYEYGPEAVFALIEWAFDHGEVDRVTARTFPDNRQSIRLLEKCGFRKVTDASDPYYEAVGDDAGAELWEVRREFLEEA